MKQEQIVNWSDENKGKDFLFYENNKSNQNKFIFLTLKTYFIINTQTLHPKNKWIAI